MTYHDKYRTRMNAYGVSQVDSNKNMFELLLKNEIANSPSYYEVFIDGSTIPTGVRIVSSEKDLERTLLSLNGSNVKLGAIIEWQNQNWLVVEHISVDGVYLKSKMKLCPSTLKWLDSQGNVKETPFTLKSSPSSSYGLEEDKIMILSNERRTILVQSNADTQQIKKGKRFIFDDRAWKVIGYNGLNEGILELTLEEDQINTATDNVELRIADYAPSSTPPSTGLALTILGDPDMRITQSKTWSAVLTDNGTQVPMQSATWSVVDLNGNPTSLASIITQTNESVTIKANSTATGYFKLKCVLNDNSASAEKQIQVKNLI